MRRGSAKPAIACCSRTQGKLECLTFCEAKLQTLVKHPGVCKVSATYSSDTYSADTYAVDEPPVKKHSLGPVIFEWATVNEAKPIEEPIAPIIQREIELQQTVTVRVHHVIKAVHRLAKLQRYVLKTTQAVARFGVSFADIVKGFEAYQESKKKRTIKPNHDPSTRSWWAQAGYCNCSAFDHVHSLKDCRKYEVNDHE